MFCGPLRLLAWEVFERLNAGGTVCSLVTGQELEKREGSTVVSCTTEMVDVSRRYDVCVIDEIQLLGDEDRGWAWTRALLGVPAREVHVCGEPAAQALLERLCALTGDALEVHHYERMSGLTIEDAPISSLAEVRAGDAVIGFSRRELFVIKREIEASTGLKACVVYGALPPEVRRQQARLFNDPATAQEVLSYTLFHEDEVVEEGKWRTRFAQKLSRTRMDLEQQSVRWPALAL